MLTFLSKLWYLLKPSKKEIFKFLIVIFIFQLIAMIEISTMGIIVYMLESGADITHIIAIVAALLLYYTVNIWMDAKIDWIVLFDLAYPIYQNLKVKAVKIFLDMDAAWHQDQKSGVLIGKVQSGVEKVNEIIDNLAWEFVPTFMQAVMSLVMGAYFTPMPFVIVMTSLIVFMRLTILQAREQLPYREIERDYNEKEYDGAQQAVLAHETITLCNQTDRLYAEYEKIHNSIVDVAKESAIVGIYKYGVNRMRIISYTKSIIIGILAIQYLNGQLSIPAMLFTYELISRLYSSFWRFGRLYERVMRNQVAVERLYTLLQQSPSIVDCEEPIPVVETPIDIKFEKVHMEYIPGKTAIEGLDLHIKPQEIVGIVGTSGAGKTTLRSILTRLREKSSGRVLINGRDITEYSLKAIREMIAYVPQGDGIYVFDEDFYYNIAFGNPNVPKEKIVWAAKVAQLHDFIMDKEENYKTQLGERGVKLSGGQKQRLAIARALVMDRPILILDEATSSLDSVTEAEFQRVLREILKDNNKTVLIIAHNLHTLDGIAERIIVMEKGKIVEEGTHEDLMRLNGKYAMLRNTHEHKTNGHTQNLTS